MTLEPIEAGLLLHRRVSVVTLSSGRFDTVQTEILGTFSPAKEARMRSGIALPSTKVVWRF